MAYSIYLVRHGQTYLNRYNKIQGWSDSPLTPKGVKDSHDAGKRLAQIAFTHAFHSDTTRAARTCRYILAGNKTAASSLIPQALSEFREQNFGYFEGCDTSQAWLMIGADHSCKTFNEIITKYSLAKARDFTKAADPFHDAEDNAEYWTRLKHGFEYLHELARPNDKILLVAHATMIRSITQHFAPEIDVTVSPKNGSVTRLDVSSAGQIKIAYYNHYLPDETY